MLNKSFCAALLMSIGLLSACTSIPADVKRPLSPETDWVLNSSEWVSEAKSVYADATEYVREQGSMRPTGSWAIVMDIDETVLNNVAYQVRLDQTGQSFSRESWYEWTQEEAATLVPGARAFIDAVRDNGGLVGFVTNRRDSEQLATEVNLANLGIYRGDDFQVFLTRSGKTGDSNKQARFDLIAPMLDAQGYKDIDVIAYVGDTIGDKPAQNDQWVFFCINQGGMYGEPCATSSGH